MLDFALIEENELHSSMIYLNLTGDFMAWEYTVILSGTLEY